MKRMRKALLLSVIFQMFISTSAIAAAPELVLQDFDGKKVPVSKYIGHGKWTLVMIWAHNCPVCNQEAQNISFFHEDHKNRDATVLGISIDGKAGVALARGFVDRHLIDFPNLIADLGEDDLLQFGGGDFVGTPTFYLYSPQGELKGKSIGPISIPALEDLIRGEKQARAD